jgi:hypothetical protein
VSAGQRGTLDRLVRDALADLGADLPRSVSRRPTQRLAPAVAEQLRLVQATWKALGYDQFAASANVRCAQFASLAFTDADYERYGEDIQGGILGDSARGDMFGLLANLATAENARLSEEVTAEMVARGTMAVLDGMGEELLMSLCLLSLRYAHGHPTDVSEIVSFLLHPAAGDPDTPRLAALLSAASDSQVAEDYALWLANVGFQDGVVDGDRVIAMTEERVEQISDAQERVVAQANLDAHTVAARVRLGDPVDLDAVLDDWADRRQVHIYPWLLARLLPRNGEPLPERWCAEARRALEDHEQYYRYSNGNLQLGIALAQRPAADLRRFDSATLVRVLRQSIRDMDKRLDVPEMEQALDFLLAHDATHAEEYRAGLNGLTTLKFDLVRQRELSRLVHTGRYAILFLSYYRMLTRYGLRQSPQADQASLPAGSPAAGTEEWLATLERHAEHNPLPFVDGPGGTVLSRSFLDVVQALFESQRKDDAALDELRVAYNQVARQVLARLFDLLADLELPEHLHIVLRDHRLLALRSAETIAVDPTTLD